VPDGGVEWGSEFGERSLGSGVWGAHRAYRVEARLGYP